MHVNIVTGCNRSSQKQELFSSIDSEHDSKINAPAYADFGIVVFILSYLREDRWISLSVKSLNGDTAIKWILTRHQRLIK